MEPTDLTIRILQEIRDELRSTNRRLEVGFEATNQRFEEMNQRFEEANLRFDVIETALREVSEQVVMQSRAIRVAIEARGHNEDRLDDLERRVSALEKGAG
ncbi:MAG: hypothetical protein HYV07_13320 [Deltaproteobacteria bacterium]|nr:hypothetical protein [Deltaproteobacteria bacterium]